MAMNLLIPVDDSDASEKAVRFVERILDLSYAELTVTMLHVVESLPEFANMRNRRPLEGLEDLAGNFELLEEARLHAGNELLDGFRQSLVTAGLPDESVTTKIVTADALPEARQVVAAREIIWELKDNNYDIVVMGRRATSPIGLTTVGSVTEKVLREAVGMSVWVVD